MSAAVSGDAAERMERMYRWQRHVYDASRKYYLWGRDRLVEELDLAADETLLEVGCGTARNLIAIAARYPGAGLYGVDAALAMLDVGRAKIEAKGLAGRIHLAFGLAGDGEERARFDLARGFDRIVFSYSLSMFDEPAAAIESAHAALAPNGRLHVVDFGLMAGLPGPLRAALRAWLQRFHVTPSDVPRATLAALAERTGAPLAVRELAGGYARLMHYGPVPG
ncbi:MAG: class I SAM-dependent methyltransferase [Alphaproteobacteria bacterium]